MSDFALEDTQLYKALLASRKISIPRNQVFQASDFRQSLTLIKKGYVKRYSITNNGNESIQVIYGPGDIFPLTWVFKTLLDQDIYAGHEVFHYETITDSVVYAMDETTLRELSEQYKDTFRDFFVVAGIRFRSNIHNLENMSLPTTEKRLAHQLAYYARFYGTDTTRGTKILIPFTQKQLASMLDATRETVSVNLKSLSEKGLVRPGTYIFVPDIPQLEEFAYS